MRDEATPLTPWICLLLSLALAGCGAPGARGEAAPAPFAPRVIDAENAGDCKLAGDLDGDGLPDLVVGGSPGENLVWYRYPDWRKTTVAVPAEEFTTDAALGDVDGDGDLDIVVPDGGAGENLRWFANPRPAASPLDGPAWLMRTIGPIGGYGKDVELADFDRDGRLDVAARSPAAAMIFFQEPGGRWRRVPLTGAGEIGREGMALGDIDGDGAADLVLRGAWLRNPGGPQARDPDAWARHPIGPAHGDFKALVVDLNQDGAADVLFSSSEGSADVQWWTPDGAGPTGPWRAQTVVRDLSRAHTLQAADLDRDGDLDLVLAQMHTSAERAVLALYNLDGAATAWRAETIATTGLHNGVVADIGGDGDYDLFGANWTGNPPVLLFENLLDPARPTPTPTPAGSPSPTPAGSPSPTPAIYLPLLG